MPLQRISLIKSCFDIMDYCPILNGNKLSPFKPKRGIRQGDPLSPYLFIMAMEYLSALINNVVHTKNWKPFMFKNKQFHVSHLLFADDVLLFEIADGKTVQTIKNIISDFYKVNEMDINLDKSKI